VRYGWVDSANHNRLWWLDSSLNPPFPLPRRDVTPYSRLAIAVADSALGPSSEHHDSVGQREAKPNMLGFAARGIQDNAVVPHDASCKLWIDCAVRVGNLCTALCVQVPRPIASFEAGFGAGR